MLSPTYWITKFFLFDASPSMKGTPSLKAWKASSRLWFWCSSSGFWASVSTTEKDEWISTVQVAGIRQWLETHCKQLKVIDSRWFNHCIDIPPRKCMLLTARWHVGSFHSIYLFFAHGNMGELWIQTCLTLFNPRLTGSFPTTMAAQPRRAPWNC